MTENSVHVELIQNSDPYRDWAKKYPVDHQKIEKRLAGDHTTEPSSHYGAGLARLIVCPPYMPDVKVHVQTIIRSQPYVEWVAYTTKTGQQPHLVDHNKVLKRLAGKTSTEPSSNQAKGLARLLYQPVRTPDAPKPPIVPGAPVWPPNSGTMHDLWKHDLVFTRALSSFHGLLRDEARRYGWTGIALQLDNAYYTPDNEAELTKIRGELEAFGHHICGWATYGQGTLSVFDEGRRQAEIAKRLKLEGWIANGETWAESEYIWKSGAWIDGWQSVGLDIPVAVSCLSSNTPDWAREFDYDSWLKRLPGSAVMPQCYGASFNSYTVHNGEETMKRCKVPKNRLGFTFDVINGQGPFPDYKTWDGPRQIWTGDDSRSGTYAALAR